MACGTNGGNEGCGSGGCASGDGASGGCSSGGCSSDGDGCPSMHVYDWLAGMGIERSNKVTDVIQVVFKGGRKVFFRNPGRIEVHAGDYVIVDADRGVDFGTVHMTGELVQLKLRRTKDDPNAFSRIVRLASLDDERTSRDNRSKEGEAIQIGRSLVDRLKLPMKMADAEWQFDRKRITFYFTAERRVDFRKLVRELASQFRTRVELRQIGVRDEAARLGGIGSCGRELCCSTWLEDFKPVSTQAAKTQDLPLNPVRLSGQCGRLKCCLNYELEQYMTALKAFPRAGSKIMVRGVPGRVRKVDIFKSHIHVQLDGSRGWTVISLDDVSVPNP